MSSMPDTPSIGRSTAWLAHHTATGSDSETIRSLVAQTKKGDAAAFGGLVDLYQQRLFRTANALLGSDADASDAVQEVFLRAYRNIAKFDDSRDLAPWL